VSARELTVEHRAGSPPDPDSWDALARADGNFVQSTLFDEAQRYFAMNPVYFAARHDGRLVGGVKLYRSASRKMPLVTEPITRRFTQLGEIIATSDIPRGTLRSVLSEAVRRHLVEEGAVSLRVSGLYGGEDGLVDPWPQPHSVWDFNVASIELVRPEEELWQGLHASHRTKIRKAERNGLVVSQESAVEPLVALIDETYKGQSSAGPDRGYVRHLAAMPDVSDLFYAVDGAEYLAGVLCLAWGGTVYYQFGGTARVNVGAGAYLHWKVIDHYRRRGMRRYVLGQVAIADDPGNPRFALGITRFKRQFGPVEVASRSTWYLLRPGRHWVARVAAAVVAPARGIVRWMTRK